LPLTRVLVNCQYWDTRFPRLLTGTQLRDARRSGDRTLVAIQDISMDLSGSIEFTREPATIDRPWFVYDPETDKLKPECV
jgi:alpha-aminoadipic semialdehyde synthase